MSEEEIIFKANLIMNEGYDKQEDNLEELLQGLLDLYQKEKEENKKLRRCHFKYEEMTGIDLLLEERN